MEDKKNIDDKNLKPVVKIDTTKAKKSTGRQFLDSFITSDFGIVREYLIDDILIPAVKDTIVNSICSAVNMIFKGTPGKRSAWNSGSTGSTFNYSGIWKQSEPGYFRQQKETKSYETAIANRRSSMQYMDISFDNRADAEQVLSTMHDILDQYPSVSVADFYDLVGYDYGSNWTCHDYGWTDLSGVIVTWSRGAWIIALPKAMPIK